MFLFILKLWYCDSSLEVLCCTKNLSDVLIAAAQWRVYPETVFKQQELNSWPKTRHKYSSLLFIVTSTNWFYSSLPHPPLSKSSLKLVCNVNIVYGNLKSENSQDYSQKPQRNCTFMNLASALLQKPQRNCTFMNLASALRGDLHFFKFTQPLTVSKVQLLYSVKEKGGKPDRNHALLQKSIQKPQVWELSRICPEISKK